MQNKQKLTPFKMTQINQLLANSPWPNTEENNKKWLQLITVEDELQIEDLIKLLRKSEIKDYYVVRLLLSIIVPPEVELSFPRHTIKGFDDLKLFTDEDNIGKRLELCWFVSRTKNEKVFSLILDVILYMLTEFYKECPKIRAYNNADLDMTEARIIFLQSILVSVFAFEEVHFLKVPDWPKNKQIRERIGNFIINNDKCFLPFDSEISPVLKPTVKSLRSFIITDKRCEQGIKEWLHQLFQKEILDSQHKYLGDPEFIFAYVHLVINAKRSYDDEKFEENMLFCSKLLSTHGTKMLLKQRDMDAFVLVKNSELKFKILAYIINHHKIDRKYSINLLDEYYQVRNEIFVENRDLIFLIARADQELFEELRKIFQSYDEVQFRNNKENQKVEKAEKEKALRFQKALSAVTT